MENPPPESFYRTNVWNPQTGRFETPLNPEDLALNQTRYSLTCTRVRSPWEPVIIEHARIDTRETTDTPHPLILNITGGWGRGPEVEAENALIALALKENIRVDLISLPGHGFSSPLPGGWNATIDGQSDFDRSSLILAEYLEQRQKEITTLEEIQAKPEKEQVPPRHPTIVTAWSMGVLVP